MLLFIGGTEIIVIVFVILILFGSKKIPEVARALGKGFREFQKASDEIKREISAFDDPTTLTQKNSKSKPTSDEPSDNQN
ncbi:MAG: twin-arginine translocase TatA/TatE family subunit [Bacteroidales bacterium]|nr:twin-arginine translocase TatA/TatE family subunit [Tenuifilaceae bacterium]